MKTGNKKSLQNFENNSVDINEVKGGKRFNMRTEFVNEPGQNNEKSEFAKQDSKYLSSDGRPETNIRDDYASEGHKGSRPTS
ncbi:MAG: hypothetical protein N4A46_12035 [Schleiferiaceae bacterium]|jgi:hypothetical protein|nr:hypothetical protein [Schleiferiaceae bacterium]